MTLRSPSLRPVFLAGATMMLASCADAPPPAAPDVPATVRAEARGGRSAAVNVVDLANSALEAQASEYRIAYAEYYTEPSSGQIGNVIFANDRGNKQVGLDFIPDDPRRGGVDGDPNTIDFWIDLPQGSTVSGLTDGETTNAIGRAMETWNAQSCSDLSASVTAVPVDLGLVQFILGFGGGPAVSDVMHAGWLPGAFFDLVAPGGSTFILGVTFTLTFVSGDLDGDGASDLAAREIYYNDAFAWSVDGGAGADVETIALHEAGHGLSQGHFGKIFGTPSNGKIHFAPRAVMNASYSGPQRTLTGTDNGGHCSIWGSWPRN